MADRALGPLLVALAALLWASDAVFRVPAVKALDPTFVVAAEHLICLVLLAPWMLFKHRGELTKLKPAQWLGLSLIGGGGSALATVLFTASFRYVNPSVSILLQKLQPVVVILLAVLFLKERPAAKFYGWGAVALLSGAILSFPDFDFSFLSRGLDPRSRGVIYAGTAAAIWALATVIGKALINSVAPTLVTFWRYVFGLVTLVTLLIVAGQSLPVSEALQPPVRNALLYMSVGPGLLSLLFYYSGLARTQASVATLVELIFPVGAVIVNAIFLNSPLQPTQILAGVILLFSVTRASAE